MCNARRHEECLVSWRYISMASKSHDAMHRIETISRIEYGKLCLDISEGGQQVMTFAESRPHSEPRLRQRCGHSFNTKDFSESILDGG